MMKMIGETHLFRAFDIFNNLLAIVPLSIGLVITYRQYMQRRDRATFYLMHVWASLLGMVLFEAIDVILVDLETRLAGTSSLSVRLQIGKNLCFMVASLLLILFVDFSTRESVDPIKFALFFGLIISAVLPPLLGGIGFNTDYFNTILALSSGLMLLIWIIFSFRLHRNAPTKLRSHTLANLMGAIFIAVFLPLTVLNEWSIIVPGLDGLIIGAWALTSAYIFGKYPQIVFILPFKALRLSVITVKGGLPLFNYTWKAGSDLKGSSIFTGMVAGIRNILSEAVNRGSLQEIHLERAILLVVESRDHPVASVLVATRSSQALRKGLKKFMTRFDEDFAQYYGQPDHIHQFHPAKSLVNECFPFVPEHD